MDESLEEIVRNGVEAWIRWRTAHERAYPGETPDLGDINLSGLDIVEAPFSNTYFVNTNFTRSKLPRAEFMHSGVQNTDFSDADLTEANFDRAYLNHARLERARLTNSFFRGAYLTDANLSNADLRSADLDDTVCTRANFQSADLQNANFIDADLSFANLSGANLSGALLRRTNLTGANLERAILDGADLEQALLVQTNLDGASVQNCKIYGISVWETSLTDTVQSNLVISRRNEPVIAVDTLAMAQFIYLLLDNSTLREVIDTLTAKAVLILGRFTEHRKTNLEFLREFLRQQGFLPILFDFEAPGSRDLTETISTLAHLSRLVIADISEPRSVPQELQAIVPHLPSVEVVSIISGAEREYGMFEHFRRYPWVSGPLRYDDLASLQLLAEHHILPKLLIDGRK